MDLICPICGEPWDNDELHEVEDSTYAQAAKTFRTLGCGVAFGGVACKPARTFQAEAAAALYDLLGDDMDGAAAEFADWGMA